MLLRNRYITSVFTLELHIDTARLVNNFRTFSRYKLLRFWTKRISLISEPWKWGHRVRVDFSKVSRKKRFQRPQTEKKMIILVIIGCKIFLEKSAQKPNSSDRVTGSLLLLRSFSKAEQYLTPFLLLKQKNHALCCNRIRVTGDAKDLGLEARGDRLLKFRSFTRCLNFTFYFHAFYWGGGV